MASEKMLAFYAYVLDSGVDLEGIEAEGLYSLWADAEGAGVPIPIWGEVTDFFFSEGLDGKPNSQRPA